jgi:hypothetical protein
MAISRIRQHSRLLDQTTNHSKQTIPVDAATVKSEKLLLAWEHHVD